MVSQLAQITANLCTCVKHVGLTTHGYTVADKVEEGKSVGIDNC